MFLFFYLRVVTRKLASPFGHPTHLRLLAAPYGQGFSQPKTFKKYFVRRVKPWANELPSNRKWTQVELVWKLALGGQTDSQVSSQVDASRKKKHFKPDYLLFQWLIIG